MKSKYFYDGTQVLKNKLDILNNQELRDAERELVSLRIAELNEKPIKGSFDLKHLSQIHLHLFQDVYRWAGQVRTCNLVKDQTEFCLPQCIYPYSETIFDQIKREEFYLPYDSEEKIKKLARLFADINALHPFREGNGRTQRIFIEWLATVSGISLDLTKVPRTELITGSIEGMKLKYDTLEEVFAKNSHTISEPVRLQKIKSLIDSETMLERLSRRI